MNKKKPTNKKKLLGAIGIAIMLCMVSRGCGPSETEIRHKVVKIIGNGHGCSGEQIKAPSGTNYILTAGHCSAAIGTDGTAVITTEDGKQINRKVIAADTNSDLLLIEGLPGVEGLSIADHLVRFQHVRTFTHGAMLDTYKTEGIVVMEQHLEIMGAFSADEIGITAMVQPGSSGGPVVNDSGQLVGVVSASDAGIGWIVRIQDIKAFLSAY